MPNLPKICKVQLDKRVLYNNASSQMINNFSIGNDHHQIMNQPRGWEPITAEPQEMVAWDDGEGRPVEKKSIEDWISPRWAPSSRSLYIHLCVGSPTFGGYFTPSKTGVLGPTLPFFADNKVSRSSKWTIYFSWRCRDMIGPSVIGGSVDGFYGTKLAKVSGTKFAG